MIKAIAILTFMLSALHSGAQSGTTININIKDPVQLKEVLLPGASAKALELYSAFAVNKNAAFYFEDASIGSIRNCRYSIICENGKVSAIYIQTDNDNSCKELKNFATTTFGKPERELTEKKNGLEDRNSLSFKANGMYAEMVTSNEKGGYLAVK